MFQANRLDIAQFLQDYPGMSIVPSRTRSINLKGTFDFEATANGHPTIIDNYELYIEVPKRFPDELPIVYEVGGRIPKNGKFHVNPNGDLCLGSPLRLLTIAKRSRSFVKFVERCIVPFLYASSTKLKSGGDLIFKDLAHGIKGIIEDYKDLFDLQDEDQVIDTFKLIGIKRRIANKKLCPCCCNQRLGKCKFNKKIRYYRSIAPRSWYKRQAFDFSK